MRIIARQEIEEVLPRLDLVPAIERGFVDYSAGRATIPPVGELLLETGEVHIKYGYVEGGDHYVIKIASGFFDNPALGLPSGNGMMLLFSQRTGEPACVLLDEGLLTDVRTAVAGAVAAKHLAPADVERIGILGTGTQARLQLLHLAPIVRCRRVLVCGRGSEQLESYRAQFSDSDFDIETTRDPDELLASCSLVVTTTPATEPLLRGETLTPGTHVTAVGSDTASKQELEVAVLARADVVVADSRQQCWERGEIHQALAAGDLKRDEVVELGEVIDGRSAGRTENSQITVADLTGVAVQDLAIAEAVFMQLQPVEEATVDQWT